MLFVSPCQGVLDEESVLLPVTSPDPRWPDQGPRVGVVGGPLLHCELNHLSFYLERALTPRLAILGGNHIFERLRMIDVLIDTVRRTPPYSDRDHPDEECTQRGVHMGCLSALSPCNRFLTCINLASPF